MGRGRSVVEVVITLDVVVVSGFVVVVEESPWKLMIRSSEKNIFFAKFIK